MTIDDPPSPAFTRREAPVQTGADPIANATGTNAFPPHIGGIRVSASSRDDGIGPPPWETGAPRASGPMDPGETASPFAPRAASAPGSGGPAAPDASATERPAEEPAAHESAESGTTDGDHEASTDTGEFPTATTALRTLFGDSPAGDEDVVADGEEGDATHRSMAEVGGPDAVAGVFAGAGSAASIVEEEPAADPPSVPDDVTSPPTIDAGQAEEDPDAANDPIARSDDVRAEDEDGVSPVAAGIALTGVAAASAAGGAAATGALPDEQAASPEGHDDPAPDPAFLDENGSEPIPVPLPGEEADPQDGLVLSATTGGTVADAHDTTDAAPREWADAKRPPTALTWIDAAVVGAATLPATLEVRSPNADEPDLLTDMHHRSGGLRPRVLIPFGVVAALVGGYCAATLLAPLDNVAPVIDPVAVKIESAPAAALAWPKQGTSAVVVQGFDTATSSGEKAPIASISKVASVMMVLQELPLKPGEQGPSFEFDYGDELDYWSYLSSDQSALNVPVGGSLTEYQMLQGTLLGSANNYIDRLADEIWGSQDAFERAAQQWLSAQGLEGITIVSPSGWDDRNTASSSDLIALGEIAMRNPVFAEIVATKTVDLPGAGEVKNTNKMLFEDPGVVGIKTGTLNEDWNLLTAKDVAAGETKVRMFGAVLGQGSDKERIAATRALYSEVEKTLAAQGPTVPRGTIVGTVETIWGDRSDVATDADAKVVMWNGSTAASTSSLDLGDAQKAGTKVGTLSVTGAIDSAETAVSLTSTIDAPSAWWRLTHPLDLFGLND